MPDRSLDPQKFDAEPDELLLRYLDEREAACPLCGYNLRGLTRDRCPECGRELRLTVGLSEPFLRAWVCLVIVLSLNAGVVAFIAFVWLVEGPPPIDTPLEFLGASVFGLSVPALAAAVAFRRQFLKRPRQFQLMLAIVSVAATAMAFLGLAVGAA